MVQPIRERVCAEVEGEVVVFLIGMRINRLWKVWKWLPVARAMPRMLAELSATPALGLLSARGHYGVRDFMLVQYWRSVGHLQAYAQAPDRAHLPARRAFYRGVGASGDVGLWHETYVVAPGQRETIYMNMPRFGLGLAGAVVPATGTRTSAAGRMGRGSLPAEGRTS